MKFTDDDYEQVMSWIHRFDSRVTADQVYLTESNLPTLCCIHAMPRDADEPCGQEIGIVYDRCIRASDDTVICGPHEGVGWHRRMAQGIVRLLRDRGGLLPRSPRGTWLL